LGLKNKTKDSLPADAEETKPGKKLTVLSRRSWIQLASGLVTMLGLPWLAGANWSIQAVQRIRRKPLKKVSSRRGRKRWPAPPAKKNPRFVGKAYKTKRKKNYKSRLAEGFYQNPNTKVIHYVDAKRMIRGVDTINERRLRKLSLNELVRIVRGAGRNHVHFSVASSVFESAALNSLNRGNIKLACDLLVLGIEHDQRFKRNRYESPSTRLYDLLAGLSVRYNQPGYMRMVRTQAQRAKAANMQPKKLKMGRVLKPRPRSKPSSYHTWQLNQKRTSKARAVNQRKTLFNTRLVKWSARISRWKTRWTDKTKRLIWRKGGTTEGIGVLR
jgi:hypothetical protein